ncbi:MAG: addiction module protein [Flavobacteriia bacterium]|nr:addiction module protein [Flavobacteriia bacterium]
MKQVILNIEDDKLLAFMNFIKTLNYVSIEKESDLTDWQIQQLDLALEEHQNGKANYVDWEDAKKDLFEKFNVK